MKKVVFLIPNLLIGGAQRVFVTLANSLDQEKYDIVMVTVGNSDRIDYQGEKTLQGELNKNVRFVNLEIPSVKKSFFRIRSVLKKEKPEVVISTITYFIMFLGFIRPFLPKARYIARETNTLSSKFNKSIFRGILPFILRSAYNRFDLIICQSTDMYKDLLQFARIKKERLVVINNPVDHTKFNVNGFHMFKHDRSTFNIVSVAHMSYQKGHDLLLKALLKLPFGDWKFHVIGRDGGMKNELLSYIDSYPTLKEKVFFHGFQSNPYQFLMNADLFVLSSRFEGFPNALVEAGAFGVPMVSFDCPGGVSEIISDQTLGLIASLGDVDDLADKIIQAKNTSYNRDDIKASIIGRFGIEPILEKYENIILPKD